MSAFPFVCSRRVSELAHLLSRQEWRLAGQSRGRATFGGREGELAPLCRPSEVNWRCPAAGRPDGRRHMFARRAKRGRVTWRRSLALAT